MAKRCNMLFFKPKHKFEEILPPPPPEIELEEKPKFFDETIELKAETFPEEREFSNLVEGLGKGIRQKKAAKKPALRKARKQESAARAKARAKKAVKAMAKISDSLPEHIDSDIVFEAPEKLGEQEDFELGTLDGYDIGNEPEHSPKELMEAQQEIKSAIQKIKEREKQSFFSRFFEKREEDRQELQTEAVAGGIYVVQANLKKAKDALIKFDLETARRYYIEIMKAYKSLNPKEQARVYSQIKNLYYERKSAEELKVL